MAVAFRLDWVRFYKKLLAAEYLAVSFAMDRRNSCVHGIRGYDAPDLFTLKHTVNTVTSG